MPILRSRLLPFAVLTTWLVACGGTSTEDPAPSSEAELNAKKLTVFDCKSETKVDDKLQRIQFSVRNIADRKTLEILTPAGKEDEEGSGPIKTTDGRVAALNENLGASTGTRLLRISGDSDGFFLIELGLYKNSGYKNGYVRIYGSEDDGPHQYSKVSCTVTQKP